MPRNSNRRGVYVPVRRARRTPQLQVEYLSPKNAAGREADRGGITSFHAAHAASWKVLEELVENILKEDKSTARPV
jgi:hypothetical protein